MMPADGSHFNIFSNIVLLGIRLPEHTERSTGRVWLLYLVSMHC